MGATPECLWKSHQNSQKVGMWTWSWDGQASADRASPYPHPMALPFLLLETWLLCIETCWLAQNTVFSFALLAGAQRQSYCQRGAGAVSSRPPSKTPPCFRPHR